MCPRPSKQKHGRRCSTTSPARCSTSNRPILGRCCCAPRFCRRSPHLSPKVSPVIRTPESCSSICTGAICLPTAAVSAWPRPRSRGANRNADEATYEYHALFRDFLLATAQDEYSQSGLRRLLEETAQLLETIERDEDAIALYRDAEDWVAVTRLLLKQAPLLLRQGRAQTLREWIAGVSGGGSQRATLDLLLAGRVLDPRRPGRSHRSPRSGLRTVSRSRRTRSARSRAPPESSRRSIAATSTPDWSSGGSKC